MTEAPTATEAPSTAPTATEVPAATEAPTVVPQATARPSEEYAPIRSNPTYPTFASEPPVSSAPLPPSATGQPTVQPSSAPTVYLYPDRLSVVARNVTLNRARYRDTSNALWTFSPVPGAVQYQLEVRLALPVNLQELTDLAYANETSANETDFDGSGTRRTAVHEFRPRLEFLKQRSGLRNDTIVRLAWKDLPGKGDFYHVFFRSLRAETADFNCLTSDEDFRSNHRLSEIAARDAACEAEKAGALPGEWGSCLDPDPLQNAYQCTRFSLDASGNGASSVFSPASLQMPRPLVEGTWSQLSNICSVATRRAAMPNRPVDAYDVFQLFVLRCYEGPNSTELADCDFDSPSSAVLLQFACDGALVADELPLLSDDVSLPPSSSSCVVGRTMYFSAAWCDYPSIRYTQGNETNGTWSPWTQTVASLELSVDADLSTAYIYGLSSCDHLNRYIARLIACFDADCKVKRVADEFAEFVFEHPSGLRAKACLGKPSAQSRITKIAAAAVVGGAVTSVLGSSVASSLTGSEAGTVAGSSISLVAILGTVQAVGALSQSCAFSVQCSPSQSLVDAQNALSGLDAFNLRIPIPDAVRNWLQEVSGLFESLSFCTTGGVDLVAQARADTGDLFSSNVFFGFILTFLIIGLHIFVLLIAPTSWRDVLQRRMPFLKLELYIFIIGFQGLALSSAALAGTDGNLCRGVGFVVLSIPTLFMLFTFWVTLRYIRPSSPHHLVEWRKCAFAHACRAHAFPPRCLCSCVWLALTVGMCQ